MKSEVKEVREKERAMKHCPVANLQL